ncbi:uncharacterized protein LOC134814297 [Bolinopsis microptera]|uniref:uncharacterized protein LOC134814297 n=1 Tax=Bolinopsis microptera TaxID=2820187 RepID=UPI00307AE4A0
MAMFFHTKQKSRKSAKRQTKNKLPKLMAIEAQVRDFFPFKIRPNSSKTNTTKCEDTQTTSINITTTNTISERTQPTPRIPSQKVTIQPKPQIIISEDPETYPDLDNLKTPKHDLRRKTPEFRRKTPERQMLYKHYAPYYEDYCKRTLSRSLTNVSDYVFRWTFDSTRYSVATSETRSSKSELTHKPKLGPLHHSKPDDPTPLNPNKPHNLEIVPRKLYLARPISLNYPHNNIPPQDSTNLVPASVMVPSVTASPHLLLDLNKCTKFRITLKDLSSASERIYRIHSLRASRNVRESVWVPSKAVVSEDR